MAKANSGPLNSGIRALARRIKDALNRPHHFKNSADYWESRYRGGGNSGAGSYNRLAEFKAEIVNNFVSERNVCTVIELGVGDGAQLKLGEYPEYIGFDVSNTVVEMTRAQFATNPSVSIHHISELTDQTKAELTLSLDVIYHLVEDETFEKYMGQLFEASTKYVIVYASNEDMEWPDPHVRHRRFTRWVESQRPDFTLIDTIKNRYPYSQSDQSNTSFADFYIFAKAAEACI